MNEMILYSLTAGCLLFLAFAIIAIPGTSNIKARYWLSFFLMSFGCAILDRVLYDFDWYTTYPQWQGILETTRFAMAPALYFSVLYFTTPDRRFGKGDLLHFVLFFVFAIYILLVLTRLNNSSAFDWYREMPIAFRKGVATTVFVSLKIQMIIYWILSYRRLVEHKQNIKRFASTIEPVSLQWLHNFLIGLTGVLFLSLNEILLLIPQLVPVTGLCYLLLTFYFGYFSLQQKEIFPYPARDVLALQEIIDEPVPETGKRVDDDTMEKSKAKLVDLIQGEKLFLDPDLGLPELAHRVGMTTHELSYVLNAGFGENFYQFVNRFRIEEAKMLLRSEKHKHLNILGIAYESGFRSKTTFNTTFKKMTGQSPSAYMQSIAIPAGNA